MKKILLFLFLIICISAQDFQKIPELWQRVTDLTQTLAEDEKATLEQKLEKFENETKSQIAVLIIPTTQPETIEEYSMRVVEKWKLGREGVDDGILLLIAKNDRKLRIEVGYGIEGIIPDATVLGNYW